MCTSNYNAGITSYYSRIHGEVVQIIVHVHRVMLSEMKQLLKSLIDENDADQRSKSLFGETGNIADQGASIGRHQKQTQKGCPETNAGSQRKVGQAVITGKRDHGEWVITLLKDTRIL